MMLAMQPEHLVDIFLPLAIMKDIAHALTYGVLAFFTCLYLIFRRHLFGVLMTFTKSAMVSFLITACWGGFTEWLQNFSPTRTASLKDLGCDMIGALIGIIIFKFWEQGHARQRLQKIRR